MKVAVSMPPMTAMPISFWLADPALLAMASGRTPRRNAMEVIRIGRILSRAASTAASSAERPSSCSSRANSTMRMAFLAPSPIVVRSAT